FKITVTEPPPLVLEDMEIEATQLDLTAVRAVELSTRPNTPVSQKVPSHEDFMALSDRVGLNPPKVAFVLDDAGKPAHGTARLDRETGELTYAPHPGYIGEDSFRYYTVDEANPQLGVENRVNVTIEPIRQAKHLQADRSSSRQVDLVFVINNSPSMAAHQARLAASLNRFRQLFDTRQLDYRIGVLTTDFVNADPGVARSRQAYYKKVRSSQLDDAGAPVLDRSGRPKTTTKRVASNGELVTLPQMAEPWVNPATPDGIFSELVKIGTNGDSNRTAFTAVYNFVANFYHDRHALLRPEATTIVVFFMDEEETRMAVWAEGRNGERKAEWQERGTLPDLIAAYNRDHPRDRQTLDGYINYWVIRPFVIAKGNQRGKLEINAVVSPDNRSHRRAAELTGGTVLNIESDFSTALAAMGDRIADTVAVALDPLPVGSTLYQKSVRVLVDGKPVAADADNGFTYDARSHRIVFHGAAKQRAFAAKIDITYEEHR
ncbi:MAG: Ig-like domain-containing protein, partial [Cephaloticoccus sp.]